LSSKDFHRYSQSGWNSAETCNIDHLARSNREIKVKKFAAKRSLSDCTKSWHTPVNPLHSIENKSHKTLIFSLTQNLKGVQQDRSLTASEVFPVGAASGAQAKSLSHCKMTKEGEQGSIAKRWSRRTRSPVEGRIEFRGVG